MRAVAHHTSHRKHCLPAQTLGFQLSKRRARCGMAPSLVRELDHGHPKERWVPAPPHCGTAVAEGQQGPQGNVITHGNK